MTFRVFPSASGSSAPRPTTLIEITKSSSQSAITGDNITFDTLRATRSSHGVSLNVSTGEISLSPNYDYWIVASVDVTRGNSVDSYRIAFTDGGGTEITASNGGFDAVYAWHPTSSTTNIPNYTLSATLMTTDAPSSVFLKAMALVSGASINANTSILICEVQK